MAKSRAQQAAIAISMKKAGKKPSLPKAQKGGQKYNPWAVDTTKNLKSYDPKFMPQTKDKTPAGVKKTEKKNSKLGLFKTGSSVPKAQIGAAVDSSLLKKAKVTPARMSTGYPEGMSKPKSKPVPMTERPKEMSSNLKNKKITKDPSGGIQYKKGGSTPAWTRSEGKNKTGGLNAKGVASYRKANPGSKLKTAVTTKPSKLKPGSKDAKRRKSFCARMSGMPGPMKDEKGRPTRKALSLRKWNC
jgi:hypothetical protein